MSVRRRTCAACAALTLLGTAGCGADAGTSSRASRTSAARTGTTSTTATTSSAAAPTTTSGADDPAAASLQRVVAAYDRAVAPSKADLLALQQLPEPDADDATHGRAEREPLLRGLRTGFRRSATNLASLDVTAPGLSSAESAALSTFLVEAPTVYRARAVWVDAYLDALVHPTDRQRLQTLVQARAFADGLAQRANQRAQPVFAAHGVAFPVPGW